MYKIKKAFYADVIAENAKIDPAMSPQYNLIESVFVVSGIFGVLEKWINSGFETPSASLAEALNTTLLKVNKG